MKKIIVVCMIICSLLFLGSNFASSFAYATNIPSQIKTTLTTNIYEQANIKSNIIKQLETGVVLNVDTAFLNDTFYKISIYNIVENSQETDFGYVMKAHCLDASINSPQKQLDYNAKIKNDNAYVFEYDQITNSYNKVNISLNKNTKIKILDGYDKNKTYTYISFYNEDDDIVSYYVKTTDISVDGINYSVIVAISTLITCAVIISIVFGLKGKKRKKS